MKNTKRLLFILLMAVGILSADVVAFRTNSVTPAREVYSASLYGESWMSLNHFFKSFGEQKSMDLKNWVLKGELSGKPYIFYANSSFYQVNGKWRHLPVTVERLGNGLYIPVKEFSYILKHDAFPEISYDKEIREYILSSTEFSITGIDIRELSNGTIIRIRTAKNFPKEHCTVWRGNNQYLYASIYGASTDLNALRRTYSSGVIRQIVPVMAKQNLQFNIKLRSRIEGMDYYLDAKTHDLVISLRHQSTQKPLVNLENYRHRWLIDTIVIDPGHGGRDPGAIAPDGTYEKDIAFDIALRLGRLIKRKTDIAVVYTRDKDYFIPLWQRPKIANEAHGKLFISIHCNSSESSRPYGTETYILAPKSTPQAIEIAARENNVIELEADKERYERMLLPEQYILATMAQSVYIRESEKLAQAVEKNYKSRMGVKTRGVKQANWIVLIGASMPAILTEVGFISNWNELGKLKKESYRQEVAQSLFMTIMDFKKEYEKEIVNG